MRLTSKIEAGAWGHDNQIRRNRVTIHPVLLIDGVVRAGAVRSVALSLAVYAAAPLPPWSYWASQALNRSSISARWSAHQT